MYVKLFTSILTSSVWSEDNATRIVWITMLALSDKDGDVRSSPSGLARLANVSVEECQKALAKFQAPDPEDPTQENEGRRIEEREGGWFIYKYAHYRALQDAEARKASWRESSRKHRQKKSAPSAPRQRKSTEAEAVSRGRGRKAVEPPPKASPETTALLAIAELREAVWTAGYDGTRKINWDKVGEHHREKVRAAFLASGWTLEEFDAGKDFGNSKKFCAVYGATP